MQVANPSETYPLYVLPYCPPRDGDLEAPAAAQATLGGFFLLTGVVVTTRKDFSFMRTFLFWGGILALATIVCAVLFHFELGTWFSVAMVLLAGGSVLYTTSAVMRDYPEDAYVAASIQLFAGVALLFWYVLRLFIGSRR
jgi:FtsH-binding integral membrane protein